MDLHPYKDLVYRIIGAAMEVHRSIGWGLLEPIYNEALHLELQEQDIENEREMGIHCFYKNHVLEKCYQADLYVKDIIIELKSVSELTSAHRAQLFNYMRLTKTPIGLLINFGQPSLLAEKYAFIEDTNECILLDKEMNRLNFNLCSINGNSCS